MKVDLISWTPDPDKLLAAAARLCYSQTHATDIMNELTQEKIEALLNNLALWAISALLSMPALHLPLRE